MTSQPTLEMTTINVAKRAACKKQRQRAVSAAYWLEHTPHLAVFVILLYKVTLLFFPPQPSDVCQVASLLLPHRSRTGLWRDTGHQDQWGASGVHRPQRKISSLALNLAFSVWTLFVTFSFRSMFVLWSYTCSSVHVHHVPSHYRTFSQISNYMYLLDNAH